MNSHHGRPLPESARQRASWPHIPSLSNEIDPLSNTLVTARTLQVSRNGSVR